ncbi:transposase [Cellvibrio sp. BR]|nr:transposase [Cellvibrio sp. BR]
MSCSSARFIWVRYGVKNFKKRLQALEAKVASLERKKLKLDVKLAVKSKPITPVSSVCKTPLVGNLKGVVRMYQQTVVDTYSKVTFAKLFNGNASLFSPPRSGNNRQ